MLKETTVAVQTKTSLLSVIGLGLMTSVSGLAMSAFLVTAGTGTLATHRQSLIQPQPNAKDLTTSFLQQATTYNENSDAAGRTNQLTVLTELAAQRTNKLLALAEKNSDQLRGALIDSAVRESLPTEVQALVEQTISLEGEMTTRIAENPDTRLDKHVHILKSGDTTYQLAMTGNLKQAEFSGQVKIPRAYLLDNQIAVVVDESTVDDTGGLDTTAIEPTIPPAETTALTNRKVAVFLMKFQDTVSGANLTPDQARGIMFTNTNSINAWYQEASFGKVGLTGKVRTDGDVFGWLTLPYNQPQSSSGCDVDQWKASADQLATQQGADLSGYDHYIYAFPLLYISGNPNPWQICAFAGLADIGTAGNPGKLLWVQGIPDYFNVRVLPHEIGHNLGMAHADAYNCYDVQGRRVALSTTCSPVSYLDWADEMSNANGYGRHFAAYRKVALGWASPSNMQTVTTSGTYTIAPMETATTAPQTLRIQRTVSGNFDKYYHIEFRQPTGIFDNFGATDPMVNGVLVRLGSASAMSTTIAGAGGRSYLLDMVPETIYYHTNGALDSYTYYDATLRVGRSFTDQNNGITITVDSISPTGAQVTITMTPPVCTRAAPTIQANVPVSGYDGILSPNGQSFTITNNDSAACEPATFTPSITAPTGWTITPSVTSVTNPPGTSSLMSIKYTPPSGTVAGIYTVMPTFTHTANTTLATVFSTTFTVLNAESTPPTVTISSPTNGARLPSKGKVQFNVSAQDLSGVAKIDLFIDNSVVKTCANVTACSYSWTMNGRVASGNHTLKAVATDKSPRANTTTTQITVTK